MLIKEAPVGRTSPLMIFIYDSNSIEHSISSYWNSTYAITTRLSCHIRQDVLTYFEQHGFSIEFALRWTNSEKKLGPGVFSQFSPPNTNNSYKLFSFLNCIHNTLLLGKYIISINGGAFMTNRGSLRMLWRKSCWDVSFQWYKSVSYHQIRILELEFPSWHARGHTPLGAWLHPSVTNEHTLWSLHKGYLWREVPTTYEADWPHIQHFRVGSITNRHRSEGFCYLGQEEIWIS